MGIQDLINNALPGEVINISPGLYNEQLIIDKPLTILGPTTGEAAIIDGDSLRGLPTIQIISSNVTVKNLIIQNGATHGILIGNEDYLNLTNILISNNKILNHGNAGIITAHGAAIEIENNLIKNNGIGSGFGRGGIILYNHGATIITNNQILNNNQEGIFASESHASLLIQNNKIEDHGNSGISLTWNQKNTSIIDNEILNCGTGNFDEEGGIVIIQAMAERIEGNTIKNCRPSGIFWGWVPENGEEPDEILIKSNTIEDNDRDGIYLFTQGAGGFIDPDPFPLTPIIYENIVNSNGRAGIYVSNLYYYSPGNANPIIHNNEIEDNNEWGVFNGTGNSVNAIDNWWGDNSGPYQGTLNPDGKGNPVTERVDFIPWLTASSPQETPDCLITQVSLKNYQFLPLGNEKLKVLLVIKVEGEIILYNNTESPLSFSTWFTKTLFLTKPKEGITLKPKISATSICHGILMDNTIQVKIDLCIVISFLRKGTLLIPSFGLCPIGENQNQLIKSQNPEANSVFEIETLQVYQSNWFYKSLYHSINLW